MEYSEVSVIIPAYQPDEKLIDTVRQLAAVGFSDIVVVNDGSSADRAGIFGQVEKIPECTLLRHPQNRGKGAALKTAMRYIADNRPDKGCAVTADADGQHLTKDIAAVALAALESGKIVLGGRDFSDPKVPARSKMGNRITSGVFRLFLGMKIGDTQTGLRAFPKKYIPQLLEVYGDGYEYETNILLSLHSQAIPYMEIPISTVYLDENKSSHFRVVRDSVRIYGLILKYLASAVAAAVIDVVAFYVFKRMGFLAFLPIPLTYSSAFLARVLSSLVNFLVNAKLVFRGQTDGRTLVKYYILAVAQIALSASMVFLTEHILRISSPALSTLAKALIDSFLFFFSFRIQHRWVFNSKKKSEKELV